MGRLTAVSSLGTIVYPVIGGLLGEWSWRAPFFVFTLALPTAVLSLMVTLEKPQGAMDWRRYWKQTGNILRERRAIGFFVLVFLCYCAIYGPINTCFPMMAEAKYHASSSRIGLVFSFVAIGSYLAAAGLPRLHAKWSFRTLILVAGFCYTLPLAFLASVPGLWLCAVPLFVSGAAQGLSLPIINDNVALLGTPMTAPPSCCKRDVRSRKPERITAPVQHHFHEVALGWLPPFFRGYIDSGSVFVFEPPVPLHRRNKKAFTLQLSGQTKGPGNAPRPFCLQRKLSVNQHILKI
ncbi:MAG: MFS transporter [Bilophila wadsworthia]